MKMRVTRTITPAECSWLSETIMKDQIVYSYSGCTYGCIASGIAVTNEKDKTPFFELPHDAIEKLES